MVVERHIVRSLALAVGHSVVLPDGECCKVVSITDGFPMLVGRDRYGRGFSQWKGTRILCDAETGEVMGEQRTTKVPVIELITVEVPQKRWR